jgi:hypothetical protein
MHFRPRFKLRSLLLAVVLVGLAYGGSTEWRNRRMRDRHARLEASCITRVERHERELAICRSHLAGNPYDERRAGNNLEGFWTDFKSWTEEAAWHAEYADSYRKEARRQYELKRYYQRRLLLP